MRPDDYIQINPPVVSVCPDCARPNFSKTNWCTACGCLLIGYDPPTDISLASVLYGPSQQRNNENINSYEETENAALHSNTSYSDNPGTFLEMAPVTSSYDSSQTNFALLSGGDPSLACSTSFEFQNGDTVNFQNNHQAFSQMNSHTMSSNVDNRQFRQRCVSGPCEGAENFAQDLSGMMFMHSQSSNSMPSDPDLANSFPNQPEYVQLPNSSHPLFFPFQYQLASPFYQKFSHVANQHIEQLPNSFQGCSINNQTHFKYAHNNNHLAYQQNQIPGSMRWSSADELQAHQYNRPYNGNSSKLNSGNRKNGTSNWDRSSNKKRQHNRRAKPNVSTNQQNYASMNAGPSTDPNNNHCNPKQNNTNLVASVQPEISTNGSSSSSLKLTENVTSIDVTEECDDQLCSEDWLSLPTELWFQVINLLVYQEKARLAQTCKRLETLVSNSWRIIRLDRYHHLTNAGLIAIGLKRPQQLHFKNCRGENLTSKGIRQLFSSCGKNLQRLSFVGCSKGAFQGDMVLLVSALYCPNLSHIDASYAPNISDQTIRTLAEASVALRSVHLNGAQNITNSAIDHLVRYHKGSLERLELFGCFRLNSKIFNTLGECHGLKALAFGFLHHLSSDGLLELVSKLPLLTSLDLRGTQKLVTDVSLSMLATNCPFLEEVVLANMSSLTKENGVITMLQQLPRLRVLDLCGLAVVGDSTLQALATSCPLLEVLDITCTSVTEQGLRHLANAPALFLKSLRVSFCYQITPDVLEKLVKFCPRLMRISLYGFSWIKKWDFLFDLRAGLLIQTETRSISSTKETAELPRFASLKT